MLHGRTINIPAKPLTHPSGRLLFIYFSGTGHCCRHLTFNADVLPRLDYAWHMNYLHPDRSTSVDNTIRRKASYVIHHRSSLRRPKIQMFYFIERAFDVSRCKFISATRRFWQNVRTGSLAVHRLMQRTSRTVPHCNVIQFAIETI